MARKYDAARESWGAIRKLPSGRQQASYPGPDGKRYRAPHTFDTLEDARAWLAGQRVDIQRGAWKSPDALAEEAAATAQKADASRFERYASSWIDTRTTGRGEPLRPKTAAEYRRYVTKGLAVFANDKLADITAARIQTWHAERMRVGKTAAGNEARFLRSVLNTAVDHDLIPKNPMPKNLTRSSSGMKYRMPTPDELSVLHDSMPDQLKLAVFLAAYGGLRLSEWRSLRRSDLTFTEGQTFVTVERQAHWVDGSWHVGSPKSEESARIVPLPKWLTADVETHLAEHVGAFPASLLFPAPKSGDFLADRTFTRAWDVARVAAGVRVPVLDAEGEVAGYVSAVREHDLRDHAATLYARTGATLKEVMAFLGHSTPEAALRYQHAAQDRMTMLADLMPAPPVAPRRAARIGE